ncbi:hypothetical protein WMY93_018164 [Mugilogobius chulae]|uniref:Uncharacterized protein n=1 Tax=Mugilogobius chulae TaxID=88201 RepID=A0AAW0NTA6_9GOBI
MESSGPDSNSISSHGSSSTLPRMPPQPLQHRTGFPANALRKNQSSDDLVRDAQSPSKPVKVPPPVPTKPKGPAVIPYGKPALHTGTFPKTKSHSQQQQPHSGPGHSPAATVRPFTPELPKDNRLGKPQTLDANSIYSMYTQQSGIQGALNRAQNRTNGFASMYGKPVISGSQQYPENPYLERRSPTENEVDHNSSSSSNTTPSQAPPHSETERIPRPLRPTNSSPSSPTHTGTRATETWKRYVKTVQRSQTLKKRTPSLNLKDRLDPISKNCSIRKRH